ncbi:large subunit of alpha-aminoadipate reductase [Globomyces sp. JEL0801]|nr:large subunit of alpha-aminoadipate reductase [Globomyces sp. JEL0801]
MTAQSTASLDQLANNWMKRLDSLTDLVLPTDYPRPIPARIVEAEHTLDISEEASMAILSLSMAIKRNKKNTSPFTIMLAAFCTLLQRYTGEQDITVGSTSSSTNPLVLRMNISNTDNIKQVIETVLESERLALEEEIPFDLLLKKMNSPEDSEDPSLKQSLFKVRFLNLTDAEPNSALSTTTSSSCDMTIFISQSPTLRRLLPIQIKVVYNSVLFSSVRIQNMLEQLEAVLITGSEDFSLPIGKMSILANNAELPNPTGDLHWDNFEGAITDIFNKNAQSHPEKLCVIESDDVGEARTFTYQQINEASNVLAHSLIENGIKREDVVVLYSYRGVDLVVAVMGVLKAGATFSVIDPAYPPERQCIYLQVSKPQGLVVLKKAGVLSPTVRAYIEENLAIVCEIPMLEIHNDGTVEGGKDSNGVDLLSRFQTKGQIFPGIKLGPDSIGTLSFTSGSTGIPKGVRGRHHSLTHFYPWMSQEFNLTDKEKFTMLSGIAHDPIQRDIFTPLYLGAQICIPTAEDIGIPGQLAEWMAKQEITVTHLTPAMGQLLSANATKLIPSLRHAFFVGDVLTKRDVLRLQHLASNTHVINMYGTTETQRAVSYLKIPPISVNPGYLTEQKDIMPAGKGMKNVQLLVVNEHGLLAGVGELGEIYVRSGGLAEGYLSLPEVTAEKFLPNPFVESAISTDTKNIPFYLGARDRMYRTGDLGRADDQVKIRGFRIELKEIDTHLSQYPEIRENVTLVRRDKDEEKTLVSYFVPLAKSLDDVNAFILDVRNYLKQKLPTYAIPSVFVPLKRMPLTPNGKIDKNALPFPDTALAAAVATVEQGTLTPLQNSLRDIWAGLLKMPASNISSTSNFFDLGAPETPLGMVYRSPVLVDMATDVDHMRGGDLNMTNTANMTATQEAAVQAEDMEEDVFDYASQLDSIDDSSIQAGHLPAPDYAKIFQGRTGPTLFVTGVTGFLGAFILASALKKFPNSTIYCLVRAADENQGLKRIVDNCARHLVWEKSFEGHVIALCGDLSASQFGLSAEKWTLMLETVDVIIHNGALGANVNGTLTALTLATTHHLKPLHFVSSTSVLDTAHYANKLVLNTSVYESDDLQGSRTGLRSGYGQTKWVAEQLIFRARARGVPATIIRPGYIVGDSARGVTNTDDFIWRLVKGCIQLGQIPRISNVINMCNVDYVADCVVEVASNQSSLKLGVFHTWNSQSFKFDDLFSTLTTNYKAQSTEYIHWRTSLLEFTLSSADHALFPLLHFVLDDLPTSTKNPDLDDSNTRQILARTKVRCADMKELMPIYLGYLCHVGFLDAPEEGKFPSLPSWNEASKEMVSRSGV